MPIKKAFLIILLFSFLILIAGCGSLVKKATGPLIENLTTAVNKQEDIELVRDGAPAFLLMIDSMVEGSPNDADTLLSAANLYSSYVSAFVDSDSKRAKILSRKAKDYAFAAASIRSAAFDALHDKPYEQFEPVLATFGPGDEELLFLVISTWAGYIQTHASNTDNLADIAKIEALANRLLKLDETYYYGAPHLVMGVLKSLLPAALGGKPELAKLHFEKAIEISEGKFLPAYVMYAQKYAKMVFDRELHDSLCQRVLDSPVDAVPELTLVNAVAKQQAEKLLAEADEYF